MFVTFEGCEGSGKTSLVKLVASYYEKRGVKVLTTREPGGSLIAEDIRNILLNPNNKDMGDITEAYLYAASRAQHVEKVIKPALETNKLVLCDRFIDSSLAYQGYARGLGIKRIFQLNEYALNNILPNLTIFIDVSVKEGRRRINLINKAIDRLENLDEEFHQKVYEGFKLLSKKYRKRIVVINGERDINEVASDIINIINKRLKYD